MYASSASGSVLHGICIDHIWAIFRISEAVQILRILLSPFRFLDNPPTRFLSLTLGTFAGQFIPRVCSTTEQAGFFYIITLFLIVTPTVLSPHFSSPISYQSPLFLILPSHTSKHSLLANKNQQQFSNKIRMITDR